MAPSHSCRLKLMSNARMDITFITCIYVFFLFSLCHVKESRKPIIKDNFLQNKENNTTKHHFCTILLGCYTHKYIRKTEQCLGPCHPPPIFLRGRQIFNKFCNCGPFLKKWSFCMQEIDSWSYTFKIKKILTDWDYFEHMFIHFFRSE